MEKFLELKEKIPLLIKGKKQTNIDIQESNINVNVNGSVIQITLSENKEVSLFVKSDLIDSELMTTEEGILSDVESLINLYSKI